MQAYTGGCHCRKVTFEVEADLEKCISCNCSRCAMLGLILTFVPATQFKLLSGEEYLTTYRFNKKMIDHLFCNVCGAEAFGRGRRKDGTPTVAINVRCLDNVALESLSPTHVDGKSW